MHHSVTKEEEIAQLLAEGKLPVEIVREGYARGTVYKVSGRLRKGGATTPSESTPTLTGLRPDLDPSLESDPEIVELRKAVRKADLETQLGQIKLKPDLSKRLTNLEQLLEELYETVGVLEGNVQNIPISGLRDRFECGCGVLTLLLGLF